MIRIILAGIAAAAISGCTYVVVPPAPEGAAPADALQASARSRIPAAQVAAFADGPISVLAPDAGELRTFRLAPCGAYACVVSAPGAAGHVGLGTGPQTIRGLADSEFWLSSGGGGVLHGPGRPDAPLAWADVAPPPMGGRGAIGF